MTEPDPRRHWHLRQLQRSLRGLANADGAQGALFPGFARTPSISRSTSITGCPSCAAITTAS